MCNRYSTINSVELIMTYKIFTLCLGLISFYCLDVFQWLLKLYLMGYNNTLGKVLSQNEKSHLVRDGFLWNDAIRGASLFCRSGFEPDYSAYSSCYSQTGTVYLRVTCPPRRRQSYNCLVRHFWCTSELQCLTVLPDLVRIDH